MNESIANHGATPPLELLKRQRSHVLLVLSDANAGQEETYLSWYRGACRHAVSQCGGVISGHHYEQHEVDITQGQWPRLPFRYLGLYELSLDGAEAAAELIARITMLHREQAAAKAPATWLYYPVSEKVGRCIQTVSSMLTVAFANGVAGQEAEFREWYATRHIRHALHIPAFVTGQCFQLTGFQRPGAREATFDTIAIYQQEGTPEAILKSFASLPEGLLNFPMLDLSRFSESVYRLVGEDSQ